MTTKMAVTQPRYKKLQARYDLLTSRVSAGTSLVPDTAYADFLREHERQTLPNTVPDPAPTGRGQEARVPPNKPHPLSANTIHQRAQHSINESARRLKAIEDHMWQHRQEERELKRAEMDIQKQRRNIQRAMKDYESKVSMDQEKEAQSLYSKEDDVTHYQRRELHHKEATTKERTQLALAGRQRVNEQTKKFMKTENELSWRYQNLLQSLEHKRSEVERLSEDFESRIRAKEEEQHRLKQELADLAITLNMEAQKKRKLTSEDTRTTNKTALKEIRDSRMREESQKVEERAKVIAGTRYENNKRGLEQSLKGRQDTLQAQQRQGGRNLLDVRSRLQHNADHQHYTLKEAEHVQLDIAGQDGQSKILEVEARRRAMADTVQRRISSENGKELREWRERYSSRENEARKREHEEQLKKLTRVVSRYDSAEQDLYSQARQAEAERGKHSQALGTMQADLELLKRSNARKLKQAAMEAEMAEVELHQKILREAAEQTRATNTREETLHTLTAHRLRAKEDRKMLSDEKREHQRRMRITNRTVLLGQST